MKDIVKQVNNSLVYDVVSKTPLEKAAILSKKLENDVFLKREDKQKLHSFKLRGAYQKISQLSNKQKENGIIAASAGNHAQGVAYSAKKLKIKSLIVMPIITPSIKINAVKSLGAKVILYGDNFDEANNYALELVKKDNLSYIPPYDDINIIIGQATIGKELNEDIDNIDYLFIPVGGGGLISGIGTYLKTVSPKTQIIGVEPQGSPALFKSLKENKVVTLAEVGLFAEGVAVTKVGDLPFKMAQECVDSVILVSDDEICAAVKEVFEDTRSIVEPSGALSVAGCKKFIEVNKITSKKCICILSGANVNFDRLRHIAERADLGENKEALFAVQIKEEIGSFYNFCDDLGRRSITEFNYRFSDKKEAFVFVGLALKDGTREKQQIIKTLQNKEYIFEDMSDNEMAKAHIRYMVGGRAKVVNEKLYRFTFPEKVGALLNFLAKISKHWNISLFHYRNYGASFGQVLVGIETNNDNENLKKTLDELNYPYTDETNNKAYKFFL